MKNTLLDIHNTLVSTLEDLDDESLFEDTERMRCVTSIARAKADVVRQIVEVDKLAIDAAKLPMSEKHDFVEVSNILRLGK